MELEGQWWKGQLAGDIYQALRYKEIKLPSYKGQSPQINLRRYFADLIAIVSNRYRLCPTARHLAVYLLDLFMDRYDITVQQLHMVALCCLLLASKFEEREDRVPKLETLNSLGCMSSMNLVLTKQGLLHMELLLLETFQWNLYLPTAAHFIEYYLSIAVNEADLHDGWPMACLEKTVLYMTKYADYFLEVSLQGSSHRADRSSHQQTRRHLRHKIIRPYRSFSGRPLRARTQARRLQGSKRHSHWHGGKAMCVNTLTLP